MLLVSQDYQDGRKANYCGLTLLACRCLHDRRVVSTESLPLENLIQDRKSSISYVPRSSCASRMSAIVPLTGPQEIPVPPTWLETS